MLRTTHARAAAGIGGEVSDPKGRSARWGGYQPINMNFIRALIALRRREHSCRHPHLVHPTWLRSTTRILHLISTIKALVAKGDHAKAKADQFYIAAGKHLKTLKANHDKRGGSWAEWEALLRTKCGIGKSRASELMQIADGRKSVEGIRAAEAVKHKKLRDSSSPVRTGEAEAVSNMERLEPASQTTAPALVAGPAGEPAIERAAPAKTSSGNRLLDAWEASSEEERNAFLKAIGEDVDACEQSTLRRGYYEGTEAALESIRKWYDKRRTERSQRGS